MPYRFRALARTVLAMTLLAALAIVSTATAQDVNEWLHDITEFESAILDVQAAVLTYERENGIGLTGGDRIVFDDLPVDLRAQIMSLIEQGFDIQNRGLALLRVAARTNPTNWVHYQTLNASHGVTQSGHQLLMVLTRDPSISVYDLRVDLHNLWRSVRDSWRVLDL